MEGQNLTFPFPPMDFTEIRILHVFSAQYLDEPLDCTLVAQSQDKANDNYEALSYVWGSTGENNLLPITVNGQSLYITSNLDSALRHLRYKSHERTLWVDAVCINQNDLVEKNRVVPEMHRVYGSAEKVIAWIGVTVPGTEVGIDLLVALSEKWIEFIDINPPGTSEETGDINLASLDQSIVMFMISKFEDRQLPEPDDLQWQELETLFANDWWCDWWDRVWTLQEAVFAKRCDLVWGQKMISDITFNSAGKLICAMSRRGLLSPARLPRTLLAFWKQTDTEKLRAVKEGGSVSLATALAASQFRSATNPRDHFYGCLGLASNSRLGRTIDYNKDVQVVFEDATRALITEGIDQPGGLNLLAACCMARKRQLNTTLPSWALILDCKNGHASFCLPFGAHWDFDASGMHPAISTITQPKEFHCASALTVRGILVDEIETFGRMVVPTDISQMNDEAGNKIIAEFHDDCWATIFKALVFQTHSRQQNLRKSLLRILVGDLAAALDSEQAIRSNYMSTAKSACFGRKLVLTNAGYAGLAPQEAAFGDKIFIVAGCDVPLILRRIVRNLQLCEDRCTTEFRHRKDSTVCPEGQCYEIVGNAYIHGIMYGEGVKLDENGKPMFEAVHLH